MRTPPFFRMDLGIVGAVVLLALWAFAVVALDAPGWAHLGLSVGIFLLIRRVSVRARNARLK
jgi:hypothetical protein